MSPGWWDLQEEMEISSTVRKVLRHGGTKIAAKALYHAAWRFFNNRLTFDDYGVKNTYKAYWMKRALEIVDAIDSSASRSGGVPEDR